MDRQRGRRAVGGTDRIAGEKAVAARVRRLEVGKDQRCICLADNIGQAGARVDLPLISNWQSAFERRRKRYGIPDKSGSRRRRGVESGNNNWPGGRIDSQNGHFAGGRTGTVGCHQTVSNYQIIHPRCVHGQDCIGRCRNIRQGVRVAAIRLPLAIKRSRAGHGSINRHRCSRIHVV